MAAVLGDESGRIFANVDDILAFNKGFLALLHSRLSSWKPDNSCLGDLFIGMVATLHVQCLVYLGCLSLIHTSNIHVYAKFDFTIHLVCDAWVEVLWLLCIVYVIRALPAELPQ